PTHSKTFGENTPAQISAVSSYISENNLTTQQVYDTFGWSVGDSISIYGMGTFNIIGFNHDIKSDGTGYAGITLFSTSEYNTGSLSSDSVVKYSETSFHSLATNYSVCWSTFPEEWQSVIVPVKKYATYHDDNIGNEYDRKDSELLTCNIFLLSRTEFSGEVFPSKTERVGEHQYEYFANGSTFNFNTFTRDLGSSSYVNYYSYYESSFHSSNKKATDNFNIYYGFCV
ncbi:MAG: hypothetical protein IKK20_03570, partial [Clostridia bacterium]|nr:hypothetical protein [Clostridia bacterium]